jgi:hypothetical protein
MNTYAKGMVYKAKFKLGSIVCYFSRCNYGTGEFHLNALYFCTRCGEEIGGRTIADLMAMPPIGEERIEEIRRQAATSYESNV